MRLFLAGYKLTPIFKDVNKKFSVRYFLNLVLVDEEERRYFKQQVCLFHICYVHVDSSWDIDTSSNIQVMKGSDYKS